MNNKLIVVAAIICAACGCRSVTVKNYGQSVVKVNGEDQIVSNGWYVSHWQHWMITKADAIETSIKPGDIFFRLNGLDERADGEGLAKVIDASMSGAAKLAAEVGSAIATAGGKQSADAVAKLVRKFVAAGGDVSKAAVACKNGACSISDGEVVCTEGACYE